MPPWLGKRTREHLVVAGRAHCVLGTRHVWLAQLSRRRPAVAQNDGNDRESSPVLDGAAVNSPLRPEADARVRNKVRLLWGLAGAAVVLRVAVILLSAGSNDISYWRTFADSIHQVGILQTYRDIRIFNHPPLAGYWAAAMRWLASAMGVRFPILFKIAPFVADLATAWLLWRSARSRGPVAAAGLATAFLWSPVAILVACFHANTDAVLAALLLFAALSADAERPMAAGLGLAAAANVKIVAIFAAPVILLRPSTWRDRFRTAGMMALGVVPFLPVFFGAGRDFLRNGVAYNSIADEWGLVYLLRHVGDVHHIGPAVLRVHEIYRAAGRWAILAAAVAIGLSARGGRRSAAEATALVLTAFLVLAPGFGIQYTVWVLPLLFVVAPLGTSVAYSLTCGTFLLLTYIHFWEGKLPVMSWFTDVYPPGAAIFGFWAWLILGGYLIRTLRTWARPAPRSVG